MKPWEVIYNRTCKICKKNFETRFPKSRICSGECKKIDIKLQQRRKYLRRKAKLTDCPDLKNKYLRLAAINDFIEECQHCKQDFNSGGSRRKYCCEDCAKEAKLIKTRILKQYSTERKCKQCGEIFSLNGKGGLKYCQACKGEIDDLKVKTNDKLSNKIKELMEEHENIKGSKINPYFLRRGDLYTLDKLKTGVTAISGNA